MKISVMDILQQVSAQIGNKAIGKNSALNKKLSNSASESIDMHLNQVFHIDVAQMKKKSKGKVVKAPVEQVTVESPPQAVAEPVSVPTEPTASGSWLSNNYMYVLGGLGVAGVAAAAAAGGGGGGSTNDAVSQPTLSLKADTGSSTSDLVTSTGELQFSTLGRGVSRKYSVDGGAADSTFTAPSSNGQHTVVITDTDSTGKSLSSSLSYTLDKLIETPGIDLKVDSGDGADKITNSAKLELSEPAKDVTRTYTVDGGTATSSYIEPTTSGTHTVIVTDTDLAGNVATATLSFTLYPSIATPTLSWDGSFEQFRSSYPATGVTRVFEISNAAGEVTKTYSNENDFGIFGRPGTAQPQEAGFYSVVVRNSDAAGNVSTSAPMRFYIGSETPASDFVVTDEANKSTVFLLGDDNDVVETKGGLDRVYAGDGYDRVTVNAQSIESMNSYSFFGPATATFDGGAGYDVFIIEDSSKTVVLDFDKYTSSSNVLENFEEIRAVGGTTLEIKNVTPKNVAQIADVGELYQLDYYIDDDNLLKSNYSQMIIESFESSVVYLHSGWEKIGFVEDPYIALTEPDKATYTVWESVDPTYKAQLILYGDQDVSYI